MRSLNQNELTRLEILTSNSVELALIEPTQTGLQKSIMDATGQVRSFLKDKNIHDYDLQGQGEDFKIQIRSFFVSPKSLQPSVASLYRPATKNGDPRIWFTGLRDHASPGDILGIIPYGGNLYVVNLSTTDIQSKLSASEGNPLKELVDDIKHTSNEVAGELLTMLREIAQNGPVPAMLNADTAIGRTLETLLGIEINSSKKPDYKGIELKAYRDKRGNRKNLFAQVPDWNLSRFKSSEQILDTFGYERGSDTKLYCTVSAITKNSQGLKLILDSAVNYLVENSEAPGVGNFVTWDLQTLHRRLLEKHNETFWIAADSTISDGKEYFQYKKVEHTRKPIIAQFEILIQQGIITVDHLIKKTLTGKVVEKGPLFKIKPNCLSLLFPPSEVYDLI